MEMDFYFVDFSRQKGFWRFSAQNGRRVNTEFRPKRTGEKRSPVRILPWKRSGTIGVHVSSGPPEQ